MNRRGFLGAILAASAAPAMVRADSLMRIASAPKVEEPELPSRWERSASGIIIPGSGLAIGDLISIAGVSGLFRITEVASASVELLPWHS